MQCGLDGERSATAGAFRFLPSSDALFSVTSQQSGRTDQMKASTARGESSESIGWEGSEDGGREGGVHHATTVPQHHKETQHEADPLHMVVTTLKLSQPPQGHMTFATFLNVSSEAS